MGWADHAGRAERKRASRANANRPMPAEVTDHNLTALTTGAVTLLELWAPWCPTCLTLGPVCDVLARQHGGRVRLARCDIDASRGVAAALGVRSVPMVVVFAVDGSEIGRVDGAFARGSLASLVETALATSAEHDAGAEPEPVDRPMHGKRHRP